MSTIKAAVRSAVWRGIAIGIDCAGQEAIGNVANTVAENAIDTAMKIIGPLASEPAVRKPGEVYRDNNGNMVYVLSDEQIQSIDKAAWPEIG